MSNSELGYYMRYAPRLWLADQPLSADVVRLGVVNNLNHLHGQYAQTRINWVAQSTSERFTVTPATASEYEWVAGFVFPLTVGAGGVPFKLHVRVGGSVSGSNGSIIVAINERSLGARIASTLGATYTVAFSGTSDSWVGSTELEPSLETGGPSVRTERVRTEVTDGGATANAEWLMVRADVWLTNDNAVHTTRLTGLYVREYIGQTPYDGLNTA